jgi:hypothetical protein
MRRAPALSTGARLGDGHDRQQRTVGVGAPQEES